MAKTTGWRCGERCGHPAMASRKLRGRNVASYTEAEDDGDDPKELGQDEWASWGREAQLNDEALFEPRFAIGGTDDARLHSFGGLQQRGLVAGIRRPIGVDIQASHAGEVAGE